MGLGVDLTQATVTCPGDLPWRSEAALAQLALGDHDSAERLAQEEFQLAQVFGAPRALGVALRAVGVVAGGDRGASLLREAIDAFERGDARLERARALADLGAMLRRRNRRTEARELLRDALDAAHRSGAQRLAEHAETELRATGARPRRVVLTGLDSLTASERRIAELPGEGLTSPVPSLAAALPPRAGSLRLWRLDTHARSLHSRTRSAARRMTSCIRAGLAPVGEPDLGRRGAAPRSARCWLPPSRWLQAHARPRSELSASHRAPIASSSSRYQRAVERSA